MYSRRTNVYPAPSSSDMLGEQHLQVGFDAILDQSRIDPELDGWSRARCPRR